MNKYDDYISRQAAIDALAGWKISPIVLDPVPTADVVEVVRCKDCKWWRPFNDRMGHCGRGEMRHKDFYCQRGERADT